MTDRLGTHDQVALTIGTMKRKTINLVNITDRQAAVGAQIEKIDKEDHTAMTGIRDSRVQIGTTTNRDKTIEETKAEAQGEISTTEVGTIARGGTAEEIDFLGTTETTAETDSPVGTETGVQAQTTGTKETAETIDRISTRIGALVEKRTHLEGET